MRDTEARACGVEGARSPLKGQNMMSSDIRKSGLILPRALIANGSGNVPPILLRSSFCVEQAPFMSTSFYCLVTDPETSFYLYKPSLVAGLSFTVLFLLCTILIALQTLSKNRWLLFTAATAGLTSASGWFIRALGHDADYLCNGWLYAYQTIALGFAPSFLAAGVYVLLSKLIRQEEEREELQKFFVDAKRAVWRPKVYIAIFCTADLVAVSIQALGGAFIVDLLRAGAASNLGDLDRATNVILAGTVWQLFCLTAYLAMGAHFLIKSGILKRSRTMNRSCRRTIVVGCIATLGLYLRNLFRLVELAEGYGGYLVRHENYAITLDGLPMLMATATMAYYAHADAAAKDERSSVSQSNPIRPFGLAKKPSITSSNYSHASQETFRLARNPLELPRPHQQGTLWETRV